MRKMRAALLESTGSRLKIVDDVEIDDPNVGEVLVRIRHCGVCHSDLSIVDGSMPYPLPAILGHEAAGTVEALGRGVDDLRIGDRVVLSMRPPCGRCEFCLRDQPVLCKATASPATANTVIASRLRRKGVPVTQGLRLGAFAEYALIDRAGVVPVPDSVPLSEAAVVGCAVQTGLGSVFNIAGVDAGETAAVIGLGGIGLSTVQGLRLAGVKTAIGIDPHQARRDKALTMGVNAVFDSDDEALSAGALPCLENEGFDYVFDCVCAPGTMQTAARLVRKGGQIVLIGVAQVGTTVAVPALDVVLKQLTIKGSFLGNSHPQRDMTRYLDLRCDNRLDLTGLVTRERPLEEINEAFDDMRNGVGIRTVLSV
ncbi:alcohol dehydrogenase catalytic domain-containing protein [Paraburkholderia sp. 40]|uniref:alcohol dehydrogenase catalytic domain-containing protein n=1 Tax=Paraburkholderia sp. 40 TaxID=2991059 RepID=UPI003D2010CF